MVLQTGRAAAKRSKQRKQKPYASVDSNRKSATRPSDVYEAEENDPQEDLKAGQRYDVCSCIIVAAHDVRPFVRCFGG